MQKTNNSSRSGSDIISDKENGYVARLRRLKIQEGILTANVNKTYSELRGKCDGNSKLSKDTDLKKYINNLKDSYIEIKNLYEDIKLKTELTEIKDLKRDILQFEEKNKYFKQYLRTELNSKQSEELTLMSNENQPTENIMNQSPFVPHSKIQMKSFNEIVPSPVRGMINAPFKCLEIHQFQEFMKTSTNRYGGWNEYNHNLFVQIWNKYNGNVIFPLNLAEDSIVFRDFNDEVLHKISGIQREDVILHTDWYSQYISLKKSQQKALDKWKENKKKIKNAHQKSKIAQATGTDDVFSTKNCKTSVSHNEKFSEAGINLKIEDEESFGNFITKKTEVVEYSAKINVSRLMRPTKQWVNKCKSVKDMSKFEFNIENISKLRVPTWRLNPKSAAVGEVKV